MASEPEPSTLDPAAQTGRMAALAQGVRQFNSWRFWDCHETLEDLWREAEAPPTGVGLADLYQGIIKLAAGFHHLLRGNHKGTVNLLSGGLRLLEPFRPRTLGVDVDKLLAEATACYERIVALGPDRLSEFDRSLIPTIAFNPDATTARETIDAG